MDLEKIRRRRNFDVPVYKDFQNTETSFNDIEHHIELNDSANIPPNPAVNLISNTRPKSQTVVSLPIRDDVDKTVNNDLKFLNAFTSSDGSKNTDLSNAAAGIRPIHFASISNKVSGLSESAFCICFQILFPFLMAGLGMVAAGVFLDKVQHWKVFQTVSEIYILVPALLGLKGNLEMTLASRLSTYANQGYLDNKKKCWTILWGNIVTVEAQAIVVAFVASVLAQTLGWFTNGKWELGHAIILCAGSLLTGTVASGLLGLVMILVILLSRKFGVNPDNVATPIAASLGDVITLSLLAFITRWLFTVLYSLHLFWIGPCIVLLFLLLTPFFVWLSYSNSFTKDVIQNGWTPVLSAMVISSCGGFVLNSAVFKFPGIAVYSPVMNGVGGNLVAIQASRISTYLHQSGFPVGSTFGNFVTWSSSNAFSSDNPHSVGAKVMLLLVIPGHIVFLFAITVLQAGHTLLTPMFVAIYLLISFIQVFILLQVCNWLILYLWKIGKDPDNASIPYLTGLGDFLGTGLLACGFFLLYAIGDRSVLTTQK